MPVHAVAKVLGLLAVMSLGGCAAPPPPADGVRVVVPPGTGEREIVNETTDIRAKGRFDQGRMDGTWTFLTPERVKIAEITYKDGEVAGPYRFYFDVLPFPAAFGKVKSAGELRNGRSEGQHLGYTEKGRVFSDALFEGGRLVSVTTGRRKTAVQSADLDARLVQTLDRGIQTACR